MPNTRATQQYLNALSFRMMPQDTGQTTEVSYAADDRGVWCRTYDRGDGTTSYQFATYSARATEDELRHEPWNGRIPKHNTWRNVTVAK